MRWSDALSCLDMMVWQDISCDFNQRRFLIDSKNVALPFTWKELGKTYIVDELETCVLADCYRLAFLNDETLKLR